MTARSLFYGWWVVAAFCVTTFISTGIRHAVGPFLKPIVADLGLDRASFSLVIALSLLLYGVFMPLAGYALDRFSVRVVTTAGTILLVISLVLTAMVQNYWQFALVYGVLVPLGLAGTGPVIASGVVARWFNKRRGTALSVLGSASMTGMSLLVPAVTWLILTTGWRATYVFIAAGILVWRGRTRVDAWLCGLPAMRAGMLGALAATMVGTLANDSGALLLEIGGLYLLAFLAYIWAESGRPGSHRRIDYA